MAPVDDVEKDKIEAKVTDGVLHITLFPPWVGFPLETSKCRQSAMVYLSFYVSIYLLSQVGW